jgi:phosphohistidine phosphatase
MRTLYILRHAKAENDDGRGDEARPLTPRGMRAAERVGELMSDRLPELILCSTALRTRQTVLQLLKRASYFGKVEYLSSLYLASPLSCLGALREYGGSVQRLLLVGHNPGLEELVTELTGEHVALPTAALAECSLAVANWADVTLQSAAELVGLSYPRDES